MVGASSKRLPLNVRAAGWVIKRHERWVSRRMHRDGFTPMDYQSPVNGKPFRLRLWDAPGGNANGPTMVLMHGLGSSAADSRKVVKALLPESSHVVVMDLPNHGASSALGKHRGPPPESTYRCLDQFNSLVTQTLDRHLRQEPADRAIVMVGHSLGGAEAANYALTSSRRANIKELRLVSPDGGPFTPSELQRLRDTLDMAGSRRKSVTAAKFLWPKRSLKARFMAPFLRAIFSRPEMRYLVHSDVLQPVLSRHQLRKLPPVRLLWGTEERAQAPGCLPYLRERLPQGSQVIRPLGVAHGDFPDAPPALMAALLGDAARAP